MGNPEKNSPSESREITHPLCHITLTKGLDGPLSQHLGALFFFCFRKKFACDEFILAKTRGYHLLFLN